MAIESRIEADLSGQNTSSQSRIEQILNGEQITPRSRIEQLLQEYNPEDPGSYHKVECTKAQYDNMQSHSSNTIYVVTYPDQSVHFYLGDDEIAGNPTLIEKTITTNGIYDAEDESADGYSIVEVDVETLSSDIEALKYIKSVGNSIIVTDIVPQNSWTLTADIKMGNVVSNTSDALISAYSYTNNALDGIYGAWFTTSNTLITYIGQQWNSQGTFSIADVNSEYGRMQTLTLRRGAGKSIFGSKSVQITSSETLQSPTVSLAIGGKHHNYEGTETLVPFNIREVTIYGVKLYDGDGVLIHDLIPANNTTTNRAGLYDVITGTFYPSSNSFDDFVKGPKAKGIPQVDLPVIFLKSIKSVGNSVILTDIIPNYNWDVFFTLKMENFVSTGAYEILGINYQNEHFLMTFPWYSGNTTVDYLAWAGFTPSSGDTYGITGKISVQDEANKQNTAIMRRGNGGCIFGKHNYTMTNRTDDTTPTHPIVISGIDEGGTIYPYSRGELTIYGIRIFNEYTVLIHDLIPAKAKSNGRAGLYDVITGTFYPSDPEHDDFVKEEVT